MIIDIDSRALTVPPEIEMKIFEQLYVMLLGMHAKLPKERRLGLKFLARKMLADLEVEVNKTGKDGKMVRPKDGQDPAIRLASLHLATYQECMKDAILLIDTEEGTGTVTAFNLSIRNPSQGGGSVSFSGNLGQRENDRGQISGPGVNEVVSDESSLHFRQ
jgi:hypothetical protein